MHPANYCIVQDKVSYSSNCISTDNNARHQYYTLASINKLPTTSRAAPRAFAEENGRIALNKKDDSINHKKLPQQHKPHSPRLSRCIEEVSRQ